MIDQITAWAVTYVIHSTIVIAAAALAARWVRSAALQDLIWKVALLGALASASLQTVVPSLWEVVWKQPVAAVATTVVAAAPMTTPAAPAVDFLRAAAIVWALGALLLSLRLALRHRSLMRGFGPKRAVTNQADLVLLAELRERAGCRARVRLSESPNAPSAFATAANEIVVPHPAFEAMTREQKRAILAHELAHLVRRDPRWLVAAEMVKAALFFQPLNGYVQRRMREASELLCDDFAVAQTGERVALAEGLTALASRIVPAGSPLPAMASAPSRLVARVARLLEPKHRPERPVGAVVRASAAAVAFATLTLVGPAVALSRPEPPEPPEPPTPPAVAAPAVPAEPPVPPVPHHAARRHRGRVHAIVPAPPAPPVPPMLDDEDIELPPAPPMAAPVAPPTPPVAAPPAPHVPAPVAVPAPPAPPAPPDVEPPPPPDPDGR